MFDHSHINVIMFVHQMLHVADDKDHLSIDILIDVLISLLLVVQEPIRKEKFNRIYYHEEK